MKTKTYEVYKFSELSEEAKQYAIDKFIDLAYEVTKLPFKELDLNPVILTEKDAVIVDARGE